MSTVIEKYLSEKLAKSDGVTTIRKHISDLKRQYEIFIKHYGDYLSDEERRLLELAIEYHDYGKINHLFQQRMRGVVKKKSTDEIEHHFLSPFLFLHQLNDDAVAKTVTYAVINHHTRGGYLTNRETIKTLFTKFEQFKHRHFDKEVYEIAQQNGQKYEALLNKILRDYRSFRNVHEKLMQKDAETITAIKVAGLLLRIDHSASADDIDVEQPPIKDDRVSLFTEYLNRSGKSTELRPFQKKYKDRENIVLVADTGLGKTGLAFLWSRRKMFYVLPNRTSTNAMYRTLSAIFNDDAETPVFNSKSEIDSVVGLLHSTSVFELLSETAHSEAMLKNHDHIRHFAKPITVTTADQLFTASYKYPTYEKIYATLSYSDIVIDEIQAFEPDQIVPMLHQIKETVAMGSRYLIITATLPEIIEDEFKKMGFDVITDDEDTKDRTIRHRVKLLDSSVFESVDRIVKEATEGKSVLVIVNKVRTSQDLYKMLKDVCKDTHLRVELLHSRFIYGERMTKEKLIQSAQPGTIWVTTQLVEASLDIDYDVLFTELAPADSIVQRMGRVYRKRPYHNIGEPNIYICLNSNYSRVYLEGLVDRTKKMIEQHDDTIWDSDLKRQLVRELYSRKNLDRDYLKKWQRAEDRVKAGLLWNTEKDRKQQAYEMFRDIASVDVIPHQYADEVRQLMEQYGKTKSRIEKLQKLNAINNYKVPVPVYVAFAEENGNYKRRFEYHRGGIRIATDEIKYDEEMGIIDRDE